MNREILFRGKRKDNKGWVYGDLNQNDVHNRISILEHGCIIHAVDPETIGQFTGLLDKEGNKIFEGDICTVTFTPQATSYHGNHPNRYDMKVEIQFRGYRFMAVNLSAKSSKNNRNWKFKGIGAIEFDEFEVIGNSHDHPHLLNKQTSNQ